MTYFDFTDFTRGLSRVSGSALNPISTTVSSYSSNNSMKSSPIYIPAAGLTKADISAEVKLGDLLHIHGKTDKYGDRAIDVSFFIPDNVDAETIEVTVADGMITITFENKKEEAKKIKVK